MSFKKKIEISSCADMIVSIFVVGYKGQGESIVVLFRDAAKVAFSMVIDCYEVKDYNITKSILKKYGVKSLNVMCWTHPHWDHTKGIDGLFETYFGDDTIVFFPQYYFGDHKKSLLQKQCLQAPAIFDKIWDKVKDLPDRHNRFRTISGYGDKTNLYPMLLSFADKLTQDRMVCFYFLTPSCDLLNEYAIEDKDSGKPNEFSISFMMSIDGYGFFFGGDVENESADNIENSIVEEFRWIKVPHHCSSGAKSIAERLGPKVDFSVSTVHNPSGLPHKDIQNIYAQQDRLLHMTELVAEKKKKYGVVQYDYRFNDKEIVVDLTTYANAGRYYPST